VSIERDGICIHHGHHAAADHHRHREAHAIGRNFFEPWTDRRALAVARGHGARRADRQANHTRVGQRHVDHLRLRVSRTEPRQLPAVDPLASQHDHGRASGFTRRGQRQRIQHLAQRGGAVEATNAVEQPRDAGHLEFPLFDTRHGDRGFQFVGGPGLRIGQDDARASLGVGHGFGDFRLELGFHLAADFARDGVALILARLLDGLFGKDAAACFGVGDARQRALFGFRKRRRTRFARGGFAFLERLREQLLYERADGLIDSGSHTIFERHGVLLNPRGWVR
jgi:hypothetical protein